MSLRNEWYVYHQNNPQVYQLICRFAEQAIRAGYNKYGISAIWERVRWEITIATRDTHFKMPNNHRAYYARLWLEHHPQHPKFFRTAVLRSERPNRPVDRYGRSL